MSDTAPGPRVAIVAEFYPSRRDPVMGIWAHRQALAVREAGADVRVIVLHRIVPPRAALADGLGRATSTLREMFAEPRHQLRDGLYGHLRALRLAAPRAGIPRLGRVGGALAGVRAAATAAAPSPTS